MIILDVGYVFQVAGGPLAMLRLLERHDPRPANPSYATIQMWHQRRAIPARWVAPVLYVLSREGHDVLSLFVDTELTGGHGSAYPRQASRGRRIPGRLPPPEPVEPVEAVEAEADIFG
jgi:hypothetical protein